MISPTLRTWTSPPRGRRSPPRGGAPDCSPSRRKTACGTAGPTGRGGSTRTGRSLTPGQRPIPRSRCFAHYGVDRDSPAVRRALTRVQRQRPVGLRRRAVLRRRSRAVHQRRGPRECGLLRPGRLAHRSDAARRPAAGRRVELLGRRRHEPFVVPFDDLRARGSVGVGAGERGIGCRRGGARAGRGVPARSWSAAARVDG